MRILFTSTAGAGHVQPMLPLALAARDAGHETLWATGADSAQQVRAAGVPAIDCGPGNLTRTTAFRERFPEWSTVPPEDLAAFMFPRLFAAVAAPAMVDELSAVADDWRPDLVVHEQAELAAPAVAARLGVPNVCHSFGSPVPLAIIEDAAARLGPVWERVGRPVPPLGGCFDHLYVDVFPPSLAPATLPYLGRRVRRRPASLDAAPDERLPPAIDELVRGGGPIGYVTFGTTFNVNDTFAAAVAAVARLDARIIVTVGPSGDIDAFGPQPANVHVHQYLPQSLVLPHAAFVVSHGGSGTMLAALASGVPQLCLPQAADQFRNGDAVAAAGAGLTLTPAAATEEAIGAAVGRLRSDASFTAAAQRVATEIAAMPDPSALVPILEDLASRPGG